MQFALRVLALYWNDKVIRYGLYTWLAGCHIALYTVVIILMKKVVRE